MLRLQQCASLLRKNKSFITFQKVFTASGAERAGGGLKIKSGGN